MNQTGQTDQIALLQKRLAAAIEDGNEALAGDLAARIAALSAPVKDTLKDTNA